MPQTIGIREAKAQLSRLARRAQGGDTITLTLHGRPIARIVPVADSEKTLGEKIAELERRGWIETQTADPIEVAPLRVEPGLAQRYLREDRDAE